MFDYVIEQCREAFSGRKYYCIRLKSSYYGVLCESLDEEYDTYEEAEEALWLIKANGGEVVSRRIITDENYVPSAPASRSSRCGYLWRKPQSGNKVVDEGTYHSNKNGHALEDIVSTKEWAIQETYDNFTGRSTFAVIHNTCGNGRYKSEQVGDSFNTYELAKKAMERLKNNGGSRYTTRIVDDETTIRIYYGNNTRIISDFTIDAE